MSLANVKKKKTSLGMNEPRIQHIWKGNPNKRKVSGDGWLSFYI